MQNCADDILWRGIFGLDAGEVGDPKSGGIVLFARNLDPDPDMGPERCFTLVRELKALSKNPLAVAIDQEGGLVSRLKAWTGPTPTFRQVWLSGGVAGCQAWGRRWGRGCRLLGINVDFAPVSDLWDGNPGTGLGDRCASDDPNHVAQAVGAFLNGLESEGVRGCLKHFPGLGTTKVDSHKELPEILDWQQVEKNVQPFRMLAHQDRLVMVAHVKTPRTGGLPASLCRAHVADNPWGIQGRWITDDMEMGGCGQWDWPERVKLCLQAGHQALLPCVTLAGVEACREALHQQPKGLWEDAVEQFLSFRHRLKPGPERFDRAAWDNWLEELKAAAV